MNGGLIHEDILLERVEKEIRRHGAEVKRQAPTRAGRRRGYGDLLAGFGPKRLLIEAEMSPKRIANDLQKAADLGATWLWILVPNRNVAAAVRRQMKRLGVREAEPWLWVPTLGQALEGVRKYVPLFSAPMTEGKTNDGGDGVPRGCESGRTPAQRPGRSQNETEDIGNDH